MGINPMKWKTRNILYCSIGLLLFYAVFIYKRKHQVIFEGVIPDSNPAVVWEYVADFSNMKKLNPTIEDFNIISETGNYDHWKYTVQYTEHLSHLPFIRNTAHGHYTIHEDTNGYLITSKHETCFISKFGCFKSVSQFRFDRDGTKDTKCLETVQYECPIAFSLLCYKEVMYQREEILKRLILQFAVAKIKND